MSDLDPAPAASACAAEPAATATWQSRPARLTDLEGLAIRRLLPLRGRRLVGPWCFLDHFGPLAFEGRPMDVGPHPHIGLQTVSWLLEGELLHHDSLGCSALATPGTLNLMTAGRGIAHSEETPASNSGRLHGVQLWVALPDHARQGEPAFEHHAELPRIAAGDGTATVVMGACGGVRSPARAFSPLVAVDLAGEEGATLRLPLVPEWEHALVLLRGALALEGRALEPDALCDLGRGRAELCLSAQAPGTRALLIGGAPFAESILMWWNFVARTNDEIAAARADWEAHRRFPEVAGYRGARIPAPPFVARVVPGR